MKLNMLKQYMNDNKNLYINDREIQVVDTFAFFDICEVVYLDNKERDVVDVLGITKEKNNNSFISLHRFLGGNNSERTI